MIVLVMKQPKCAKHSTLHNTKAAVELFYEECNKLGVKPSPIINPEIINLGFTYDVPNDVGKKLTDVDFIIEVV